MVNSVKPTVVVAGFGSWAMTAVNPAAEAVKALGKIQSADCYLHCMEVPVDTESLYGWLESALQKYKPDIWLGVGVAVDSPVIRLENIGINMRCFDVPDIGGRTLNPTLIVEDGPVAYRSTLQQETIVDKLRTQGIPAALSFHAGTHLCNQMLYSVLHLSKYKALNLISGFVHVPQSTDNVAIASGRDRISSSMSIAMMVQAITVTVDCAVQQFVVST
jgi:pyroglutamyl-peptidase